jgi:hypothetical protein
MQAHGWTASIYPGGTLHIPGRMPNGECNFSRICRIANATFREFATSWSLDNMASISRDCGDFLLGTDGGRRPFH